MKTILFAVLLFLVFSFQITVSSEVPLRLKDAKKLALQGYGSFVNNKYSKAINQFAAVEKYIIKNPRYKKSFDHYYRSYSMITFIQKHRELKLSRNIHKHRVLIIYVKKTDVYYRGRRIQENFTDELIKRARISQNVAKRYYEVLSHGNFTLTFDEHQINSTIRKLKKYTSYKKGKVKPDISSLTPYPHNLFFKAVKNYDTIVIYWPALALHKAAKKMSKSTAPALGGTQKFYLINNYVKGAKRGKILIPSRFAAKPGVFLHEMFHVFESCFRIRPAHGFRKNIRKHFPLWRGNGEMNYYQYHIDKKLAQNTLQNFEFNRSYPLAMPKVHFRKLYSKIANISKQKILKAEIAYKEAKKLYRWNKDRSKKLLEQTLSYNPLHFKSLLLLGKIYRKRKDYYTAMLNFKKAYSINPYDANVCLWMGMGFYRMKKINKAKKYLDQAVSNNPKKTFALYYRAFLHFRTGNIQKALKDYKSALSLSKKYKYKIRRYLQKQKGTQKAKADYILRQLNL